MDSVMQDPHLKRKQRLLKVDNLIVSVTSLCE